MIRGSQYADSTATPTVKGSQFAARPRTTAAKAQPSKAPPADLVAVKGGYVSKTDFQAMSAADQERVKSLGVEGFNKEKQASYQRFTTENIEVRPNEWMPIASYDQLSTEDKSRIKSVGIKQFNDENKAKADVFKATHVEVRPDEWALKTEFDALSSEDQSRMRTVGIETFNTEKDAAFKAANIEIRPTERGPGTETGAVEWVSKEFFNSLTPADQNALKLTGLERFQSLKQQERDYAVSKLKAEGCFDDQDNIYPAKYLGRVGVDKGSLGVLRMAGLSEAEIDSYAKDIQGKIDTMVALTPYHVPTAEQEAALSSGKMITTEFFPESGVGASFDVITAAAQNKVTTTQLLNARFIEDTPQAIKEFEDKVAVKKALVPYKDNAVNAVIDKAVTLDQVESLGYDRKQVQTAVDALTALKDYYVPEYTVPNPDFIGPVDKAHSATSTITVPAGYNIYQAVADGKVTTSQLVKSGFIPNDQRVISQFETDVSRTQRINTALQAIDDPKYVSYINGEPSYNIRAIYHDKVISPSDVVLLFGAQPGDSPNVASQKKAALKEAIKENLAYSKKELAREYRPVATKATSISKTYLDWTVPGYATQRHWNEMSTTWKAVSIVGDVLAVVPMVGAAGKGARGVTLAAKTGARTARLASAGKAVFGLGIASTGPGLAGKSLRVGEFWRQVAWAPELIGSVAGLGKKVVTAEGKTVTGVRAVGSNVRTFTEATVGRVKATMSPVESLLHPKKIPESSVSVLGHSAVFRISDVGEDAMRARNELMGLAASGKPIVMETGDVMISARQSRLMRETRGLAHATPSGDEFIAGTIVKYKTGMPLREQGLFWSHDPVLGFSEASAYGKLGKKPSILISSSDFAQKFTESSRKIYRDMMEMERISPIGTKIPEPEQVLFTRLGHNGVRVQLLLGTKLTSAQILKLKALGLLESIKNIYEPAITIESKAGKSLTDKQVKALAKILDDAGEATMARNLRYVAADPSGTLRTISNAYRGADSPDIYRVRVRTNSSGVTSSLDRVTPQKGEGLRNTLRRAESVNTRQGVSTVNRLSVNADRFLPTASDGFARLSITRHGVTNRIPLTSRPSTIGRTPAISRTPLRTQQDITRQSIGRGGETERQVVGREGVIERGYIPRTGVTERGYIPRESITKQPSSPRGRVIVPPFKGSPDEGKLVTYPEGAVGWRQGKLRKSVYYVMYKEHGKIVMKYHGQTPPVGVKLTSGARSAYESFGRTSGRIPKIMQKGLGIMDVQSLAHGKEMRFKRVLSRGRKGKPTTSKVR